MEYFIIILFIFKAVIITMSVVVVNQSKKSYSKVFDYSKIKNNEEFCGTVKDAKICDCTIHAVKYNLN